MEKMKRLSLRGLGAIGTGFTNFASGFARQALGYLTKSLYVLTLVSIEAIPLFAMLLILSLVGSCLFLGVREGQRLEMATPESQGGIDYPDGGFSSGAGVQVVAGDLAELAARMGSPTVFDRAGNVVRIETFERGMAMWGTATYGAGAEVKVSSYRALSSAYSLYMRCGEDGVKGAKATYQVPYFRPSRFGLEYAFTLDPSLLYHYFELLIRDGSTQYLYSVLFYIQTGQIAVKHSDGARHLIASGLNLKTDAFLFHHGKMVVDMANKEYVSFLYDNYSYDISDYAPYETADSNPPYLEVSIEVRANDDTKPVSYIDTVLITRNEPIKE